MNWDEHFWRGWETASPKQPVRNTQASSRLGKRIHFFITDHAFQNDLKPGRGKSVN